MIWGYRHVKWKKNITRYVPFMTAVVGAFTPKGPPNQEPSGCYVPRLNITQASWGITTNNHVLVMFQILEHLLLECGDIKPVGWESTHLVPQWFCLGAMERSTAVRRVCPSMRTATPKSIPHCGFPQKKKNDQHKLVFLPWNHWFHWLVPGNRQGTGLPQQLAAVVGFPAMP